MMKLIPSHDAGQAPAGPGVGFGRCPLSPMAGVFCDDELDPLARRQFQQHLGGCEECAAEVERVRELSDWFEPVRWLDPKPAVLDRLHQKISSRADFDGARRMTEALPLARMLLAAAASVLIVAGAWLFDGSRSRVAPRPASSPQRLAAAPAWERMAVTLQVDPPDSAGILRMDQERLADEMVAMTGGADDPSRRDKGD